MTMRFTNSYRRARRVHGRLMGAMLGAAFCAALVLTGSGCGDSGGGVGPEQPPTRVEKGWTAFEAGNYAGAKREFEGAIADDGSDGAAHNGLGWTNLRLDSLVAAVVSFDAALTNGFAGADPHAGRAIALRDLEPVDFAAAITAANTALGLRPGYTFSHDTSLNWEDLRLVLAQSQFATGAYAEANAQVGLLGGTMQDPAAETFVQDLLAEIERIGRRVGG